jgi:hypothetical protein
MMPSKVKEIIGAFRSQQIVSQKAGNTYLYRTGIKNSWLFIMMTEH